MDNSIAEGGPKPAMDNGFKDSRHNSLAIASTPNRVVPLSIYYTVHALHYK